MDDTLKILLEVGLGGMRWSAALSTTWHALGRALSAGAFQVAWKHKLTAFELQKLTPVKYYSRLRAVKHERGQLAVFHNYDEVSRAAPFCTKPVLIVGHDKGLPHCGGCVVTLVH